MQPGGLGHPKQTLDDISLDRHEEDLQFATRRRTQNLVIPNDLFEREGDVLLGFVLDDLRDFARVHRRKFDEFGEDVEARGAHVYILRLDAFFGQQFLQRFEYGCLAGGFLRTLCPQRFQAVLLQQQATGLIELELGQLEAARPKIYRQK